MGRIAPAHAVYFKKANHTVTSSFSQLDLVEPLQRALKTEKYTLPTPIQAQAIPHLLAGRDLLGIAQTGTGKTAAFALPILQRLSAQAQPAPRNSMRALILTPTRELATQIPTVSAPMAAIWDCAPP